MYDLDRRTMLGYSLGSLALVGFPATGFAQAVCSAAAGFLPSRVTVDCASRKNFQVFRKNPDLVGLTGVVSMSSVRGKLGQYEAGSLMLFPWLKPKSRGIVTPALGAALPVSATQSVAASPIGLSLPADEHFCRDLLGASQNMFIGFMIDAPYDKSEAARPWFSNVDKLSDGKGVGIDWTSSNLNHVWFGGSRSIPATEACNGSAWRKVIVDGLQQASVAAC